MATTAVIFDLDDTLADFAGYDGLYFKGAMEGAFQPIDEMVRVFNDHIAAGIEPLIVTARPAIMRDATIKWVREYLGDHNVYMTTDTTRRKDEVVKREIVIPLMAQYDIVHAFDDKATNIAMFAELGIAGTIV